MDKDDAKKGNARKDGATKDDEVAQGIDVSMGDGAGATGSGLSALERSLIHISEPTRPY